MDALRHQIRLELEEPIARGTRWGTATIGTYFVALLPMYFSLPGGWQVATARWVTATASLILLGIAFSLRRPPRVAGRSERVACLAIGVVMVQVLANLLVRRSWVHTSDLMILLVATAIIVQRRSFFIGLLLVGTCAWGGAALLEPDRAQLLHWAIGMTSALLVSLVVHAYLRGVWTTQEQLLLRDRLRVDEKARLIAQLEEARDKVKTLHGLIPICAHCKKVRNDTGFWEQVESYVRERSEAQFSHGICPECSTQMRAEFAALRVGTRER